MPVPTGAASLLDIQTEFGGANPIAFDEYYNVSGKYGFNVTGIPASGAISINDFRGKSKPASGGTWPVTAVQTDYNNFGLPWGVGSTSYEWVAGAQGWNITRSGGTTFNNLGSDNYAGRPNFINYQSLILQAKAGDTLGFYIRNGANSSGDYEVNSLLLHLGSGWFVVSSVGGYGGHTDYIEYTLPANQSAGSYGIAVYNNYSSAGSSTWASANFYSLHVVA